jgi:hypothetical protein
VYVCACVCACVCLCMHACPTLLPMRRATFSFLLCARYAESEALSCVFSPSTGDDIVVEPFVWSPVPK